jgi:hypothetical protein
MRVADDMSEPAETGHDGKYETAALIEARLALVAAAYPSLVNDESRELIRSEIAGAVARDARLRAYGLGNSDEPIAPFRPYRTAMPEGEA